MMTVGSPTISWIGLIFPVDLVCFGGLYFRSQQDFQKSFLLKYHIPQMMSLFVSMHGSYHEKNLHSILRCKPLFEFLRFFPYSLKVL